MAIAVEGTNTATSRSGTLTVNLTTSGTNRIGLLFVNVENTSLGTRTVTSVTTSGLTWAKISGTAYGDSSDEGDAEIWWAYIPAANTYSVATIFSGTYDDAIANVLAVSGLLDFTNPFDPNGALPAISTHNVNTATAPAGALSTTDANTIAFSFVASFRVSTASSGPSDGTNTWTLDENQANFNGGLANSNYVAHEIYSSVKSSLTVTWPNTMGNWGNIIIALTNSAPFIPSPMAILVGY